MDINDVNWSCERDGELFEFESSGSTIRGCHWKCSKDPKYVLLFLHGLCSNVEFNANFLRVFPTISEKYPQLNYESGAALATDHHGNGFSDGTTTTVNEIITEACDLIKYTRSIYKDLPIFLMGHSLGGLSSLTESPRIHINDNLLEQFISRPRNLKLKSGIYAYFYVENNVICVYKAINLSPNEKSSRLKAPQQLTKDDFERIVEMKNKIPNLNVFSSDDLKNNIHTLSYWWAIFNELNL